MTQRSRSYLDARIRRALQTTDADNVAFDDWLDSCVLKDETSPVFNVESYGASPSASAATNTAAIQAAIDAANAAGGGVVYIPAGTYLVSGSTIQIIYPNVTIRGAGVDATIIKLKDSPSADQGPAIQLADYSNGAVRGTVKYVGVYDLTVDGNKDNQFNSSVEGSLGNSGIVVEDAYEYTIAHVKVKNCNGYGIGQTGSHLPYRANGLIEDVEVFGCHYDGLDFKAGISHVVYKDVRTHSNGYGGNISGQDGMGIDIRGEHISLYDCVGGEDGANASGNFRIRENAGTNVTIYNCESYNAPTNTAGLYIAGNNSGVYEIYSFKSRDDYFPIRQAGGNVVLHSPDIKRAGADGVTFVDETEDAQTTTLESVTIATGEITVDVADNLNFAIEQRVRITDGGSNWVEGFITNMDATASPENITIDVDMTSGSGTLSSGEDVIIRTMGSFKSYGGNINDNTQDGISATDTIISIETYGTHCDNNGRYGYNIDNNVCKIFGGSAAGNASAGLLMEDIADTFIVEGADLGDNRAVPAQDYGIQFAGTNSGLIKVTGCDFEGNVTGPISGTRPIKAVFKDNVPYLSDNNCAPYPSGVVEVWLKGVNLAATGATAFDPIMRYSGARLKLISVEGRIASFAGTLSTQPEISIGSASSYNNQLATTALTLSGATDEFFYLDQSDVSAAFTNPASATYGFRVVTAATGTGLTLTADIKCNFIFAP